MGGGQSSSRLSAGMATYLLHLLEDLGLGDDGRRLLDDLLVPPLDRAVAAKERYRVPVIVGQELDLEVARALGQLHYEDRRARDFRLHLPEEGRQLLGVLDLADALAAPALAGLHHNGEADFVGRGEALLDVRDAALLEQLRRDLDLRVAVMGLEVGAGPGQRRHLRRLGDDTRGDFVPEGPHRSLRWACNPSNALRPRRSTIAIRDQCCDLSSCATDT
jgi:hypothetical protein